MSRSTILIVSDIHYAGAAERVRNGFQWRGLNSPLTRQLARSYYHHIWLRDPFAHNHLVDRALAHPEEPALVIANGDFSCDTAHVGLSDDAAFQSAQECLGKLRTKFAGKLHCTIGDHELGKIWLFGGAGGPRLESWRRTTIDLGLQPFWQVAWHDYILIGVCSTLIALPVFEPELLPAERAGWEQLRAVHLAEIRAAFARLRPDQRVLLFCHDPTALPFLGREGVVRERFPQIEHTIIGHLHTQLVFRQSRLLAGMPTIPFLGNAVRRMSMALREARCWRPFRVRLCPSLAGVELLKDGGYLTGTLDSESREPARFQFHPLAR